MGALLTAALLLIAEAPAPPVVPQDRPRPQATRRATTRRPAASAPRGDVYYPNCDAARAAGAAPIRRGQPGYRAGLDRDGDGIACEPWRSRR